VKGRTVDPDAELMLEFVQGNLLAFEQILKKYKSSVMNIAYHFIQDRAEAEDIAQEVFLKVHNSANRYSPSAKFSSWLYKITTNTCLNKLRSKKYLQIVSLNKSMQSAKNGINIEIPDTSSRYSEESEKNELCRLLKKAIDSLPVNQRMATILQKYEELSYREIAEIMECSTSAVDSLLHRAKQNLKRKLAPYLKKT